MKSLTIVVCAIALWAGIAWAGAAAGQGSSLDARPQIICGDQSTTQQSTEQGVTVLIADLGGSLVPSAEEKKRVPKESPEKKKEKNKPSDQGKEEEEDDDDDDDCWASLAEGVIWGICYPSEEEEDVEVMPVVPATPESIPSGWIPPESFPPSGQGDESVLLTPPTPPIHETFQQPAFQLVGDVSATLLTGGRVDIEYDKVGFHAGLWGRIAIARYFQTGAGFTYSHFKSDPKFNYESSTRFDMPVSSSVGIFELAIPFGQTIWESGGSAYFAWSVGPALFRVEEKTEIDFQVLQDGEPTGESGHRTDKSVHYRAGADIRLGVKGVVGGVVPIGFSTGVYFIHWDPEMQESQTLDFIEGHTLVTYYAGLSFGYSSR